MNSCSMLPSKYLRKGWKDAAHTNDGSLWERWGAGQFFVTTYFHLSLYNETIFTYSLNTIEIFVNTHIKRWQPNLMLDTASHEPPRPPPTNLSPSLPDEQIWDRVGFRKVTIFLKATGGQRRVPQPLLAPAPQGKSFLSGGLAEPLALQRGVREYSRRGQARAWPSTADVHSTAVTAHLSLKRPCQRSHHGPLCSAVTTPAMACSARQQ